MKSLHQRWRDWSMGQINSRGNRELSKIRNELRVESATVIKSDLETILGPIDESDDLQWDKAIAVAKAGSGINIKNARTAEQRRVALDGDEQRHLDAEEVTMTSQKGVIPVIIAVALAAFLQGHVQSSINAGSLFAELLGVDMDNPVNSEVKDGDWETGAMNASPFLVAALVGAPASLPTNYYIGRRGALMVSAWLIIASSIASAFAKTWEQLLGYRIIGGVGMGIKAVSAPILVAESVQGFWRGSIMITWQLWVACGIMMGFVINLVIASIGDSLNVSVGDIGRDQSGSDSSHYTTLQFILGAPVVPSIVLMVAVYFCYESPRFYMRQHSPNFNPKEALRILEAIRPTKLQAKRDFIMIRWSTKKEKVNLSERPKGLTYALQLRVVLQLSWEQYRTLFKTPRLRNALWSTCTVNLAQQLCGINVFAFYSNSIFSGENVKLAMLYSFGFGIVNFFCCLPAMRTIDTSGRRVWLLATLPLMCLMLVGAAGAYPAENTDSIMSLGRTKAAIMFIFLFAAAYSPGLGPIPFTLASESFPLTHREAGASAAICVNLFFAGILTIVIPAMKSGLTTQGLFGFFAGMNVIALVLVYLLVEETRWVSLEELNAVYERPKREFVRYQLRVHFRWVIRRFILWKDEPKPATYDEHIADAIAMPARAPTESA